MTVTKAGRVLAGENNIKKEDSQIYLLISLDSKNYTEINRKGHYND